VVTLIRAEDEITTTVSETIEGEDNHYLNNEEDPHPDQKITLTTSASVVSDGSASSSSSVIKVTQTIEEVTWGIAYCVDAQQKDEVIRYLDYREKGGYTQSVVDVYSKDSDNVPAVRGALIYMATTDNPEYLGPAPLVAMADHIFRSVGPSGPNKEYLFNLAAALREMDVEDPHIFELEEHVRHRDSQANRQE